MSQADSFTLDFKFGGNVEFLNRLETLMRRVDATFDVTQTELNQTKQGINNVGREAEKNIPKINGLGGSFSSLVGPLKAVAAGFIGLSTVRRAVSSFSEIENLNSSMSVLLGDKGAAKQFSDYITKFANDTPYSIASLAGLSKGLIQYNIPLERSKVLMAQLGDIALGDEGKMMALGNVLGQVASAGKLQGQDFMQFRTAMFNPLTVIHEMTGREMSDLQSDMSKGLISFDMVTDAMKFATEKGGKFYKGMEVGAKTLSGLWSTAMDNINMSLAKAVEKNQDKLKGIVVRIGKIDFGKLIDGMADLGSKAITLAEDGEKLIEVLAKIPNLVEGIAAAFVTYKLAALGGSLATADFSGAMKNFNNQSIGMNRNLLKLVGSKGGAMGAAIGTMVGVSGEQSTTVGGNLGELAMAMTAGAAAGGLMGAAMAGLAVSITNVVSALSELKDVKMEEGKRDASYKDMNNAQKALSIAKKQYDAGDITESQYKATYDTYMRLFSKKDANTAAFDPTNSSYNLWKENKKEGAAAKGNVTNVNNVNSNNITQNVDMRAEFDKIGMLLNANLRSIIERQVKLNYQTSILTEI